MIIKIILEKKPEPILFNKAMAIDMSNKLGLTITGKSYQEVFPLESIKSLVVYDESTCN